MTWRTNIAALCLVVGCEAPPEQPDPLDALDQIADESEAVTAVVSRPRLETIEVFGRAQEAKGGSVRVVLSFSGAPVFEQERLASSGVLPPRLSIRLPGVDFATTLARAFPVDAAGLVRVRLGEPEPRVVLDLSPGARHRLFYFTDPHRIVIDVSQEERRALATRPVRPVVVIDPGHGGRESGTAHQGLVESMLALDLAKRTAQSLRAFAPRARVVLTRDTDTTMSLAERSAIANALSADVFVSIHLNGSSEPVRKGGVTTFVLDVANDQQATRLAARENGTDTDQVTGIQEILAKLHRKGQSKGSRRLAQHVQRQTLAGGRRLVPKLADRGVRSALFHVLVGATMPAVLVEASFLTRDEEAAALRTVAYRDALSRGMARGIARYLWSL